MTFKSVSLGAKLIISSVSVVLLCLSAGNYWIHQETQYDTSALAQKEALALGERYAHRVQSILDEGMIRGKTFASIVQSQIARGKTDRTLVQETMKQIMEADRSTPSMWVAFKANAYDGRDHEFAGQKPFHDESGRFISSFYDFGSGITPFHVRGYKKSDISGKYYWGTRESLKPALIRPIGYMVEGRNIIISAVTYPIFDKDGGFAGAVGTSIYLTALAKQLAKLTPYDTGSINLITNDGYWVSHKDAAQWGQPIDQTSPVYVAAFPHIRKGERFTFADENQTHLFLPIQIKDSSEPWSVVVTIPNAALTQISDKLSSKISIMTVVVIVVMGAALMLIGARVISNPIRKMTDAMNRLAGGNFQIAIPALKQADEIGEMARAVLVFKENAIERAHLEAEQERSRQELKYRASHDQLTGLYNRFALQKIEKEWLIPHSQPFALLYLDLDNFKNINDAFGHACGDIILSEVARRLRETVPKGSAIVRHGGDEFVIFVSCDDGLSLDALGADVVDTVSKYYQVLGLRLHIGASVGISRFPQDGAQLDPLMIAADLAMRIAKRKKNSHAFYSQDMHDDIQKKVAIEYQLRHALGRDEIYMVYQPQISADGALHGVEALVRWDNAELGFVSPDQFIAVAEETGQIIPLGEFIMRQACAGFAQVLKECALDPDGRPLSLSINISVSQFLEGKFKDKLLAFIERSGLNTQQVTIEITESLFIDEPETVLPLLENIRQTGVRVSLDDFGTGYSSLSTLRTLPIDELKVDKAFIDNICHVKQDAEMTRSIIEMGHTMNMYIVSEGVEDVQQVELLKSIGSDVFQGYYYSKPLRQNELIAFIRDSIPR